MSAETLADWRNAIRRALAERDIEAVPHLLVLMALDGYGHEAEAIRRSMVGASQADSA